MKRLFTLIIAITALCGAVNASEMTFSTLHPTNRADGSFESQVGLEYKRTEALARLATTGMTVTGTVITLTNMVIIDRTNANHLAILSDGSAKVTLMNENQPNVNITNATVSCYTEFTRPADGSNYLSGDVVSANVVTNTIPLTLTNVARVNGGSGWITFARLMTDNTTSAVPFRVWLYTSSVTNIPGDNAPFTLLYTNRLARIGPIDMDTLTTEGTGSDAASAVNTSIRFPFVCAPSDRNLYWVLEAKGAFTPKSGQQFFFEVRADQN